MDDFEEIVIFDSTETTQLKKGSMEELQVDGAFTDLKSFLNSGVWFLEGEHEVGKTVFALNLVRNLLLSNDKMMCLWLSPSESVYNLSTIVNKITEQDDNKEWLNRILIYFPEGFNSPAFLRDFLSKVNEKISNETNSQIIIVVDSIQGIIDNEEMPRPMIETEILNANVILDNARRNGIWASFLFLTTTNQYKDQKFYLGVTNREYFEIDLLTKLTMVLRNSKDNNPRLNLVVEKHDYKHSNVLYDVTLGNNFFITSITRKTK